MSTLSCILGFTWLIFFALGNGIGASPALAQAMKHFDRNAVWSLPENARSELINCPGMGPISSGTENEKLERLIKCHINTMKKYGASPQAAEFAKLITRKEKLFGYMSRFDRKGKVDLCEITFPERANTNLALCMVNGSPVIVSTEDHIKNINVSRHPVFIKLLKKYPRLDLWQCDDFISMQQLSQGGQRFIFSYFLKDGCNACKVGGFALISYDFDQNGVFKGTKLIDITDKVHRK